MIKELSNIRNRKRFAVLITALISAYLFLVPSLLLAQDLSSDVEQLKSSLKDVITDKYTRNQKFETAADVPYILDYELTEITQKGKSSQEKIRFNLADIDENLVRRQASGSDMIISLKARNQQKLFQEFENGLPDNYVSEFQIYVNDIDEARIIMDLLKKLIPLAAKKMETRLQLDSYDDMLSWMENNVGTINKEKSSTVQAFKADKSTAGKVMLKVTESSGSKMTTRDFEFNLSDISTNLIRFEVKTKDVEVYLPVVRAARLIKTYKDGVPDSYDKDLVIYAESIDQARDMTHVLKMLCEKAGDVVDAARPELPATADELIEMLNKEVARVDQGDKTISQRFEKGCISALSQIFSNTKGSNEDNFAFSFQDINPDLVDYKIRQNTLLLELHTETGQDLIREDSDGEVKGFVNGFSLYVNDPESARNALFILKALIAHCQKAYKSPVPQSGDMGAYITWLNANITDINMGDMHYKQSFTGESGDDIRFELTSSGSKKSDFEVFEFNLCDIDPNSVDFKIKGKDLFVELSTQYRQKIIKAYKNGKTQNFTDDLLIRVADIESARNIIEAFKKAVGTCEK